jgi:hypothetical protein
MALSRVTVASSAFFSLPSSCARFWSFQTAGSASACSTALRRFCLPSRSKIPPQLGGPGGEVLELSVDLVEAFGFHDYGLTLRSFQYMTSLRKRSSASPRLSGSTRFLPGIETKARCRPPPGVER